jgi:hypothetical protein
MSSSSHKNDRRYHPYRRPIDNDDECDRHPRRNESRRDTSATDRRRMYPKASGPYFGKDLFKEAAAHLQFTSEKYE